MAVNFSSFKRRQSFGEEVANSISHGVGFVAAMVGSPFLIMNAVRHADTSFVVGVSIFCVSMMLLYLASTLYHATPDTRVKTKRLFCLIDHSAVYLLIAGTYTPITLGVLKGTWGWVLLSVVWGLAFIGMMLEVLGKASSSVLSTGLYVLLGWLIIVAIKPLVALMQAEGVFLLFLGGVLYTVGVLFYVFDSKLRYGHFIWHLFVISGTVSHYFAIYFYGA